MVASQGWELQQLDIKTAFLSGELEETIYMQQLRGYEKGSTSTVYLFEQVTIQVAYAPRA